MRTRDTLAAVVLATCMLAACDSRLESPADAAHERVTATAAPPSVTAPETAPERDLAGRGASSALSVGFADAARPTDQPAALLPRTSIQSVATSAMIIRTGNAVVEVDSLERGVEGLRALARSVGGYVANVSMQGGRDQLRSATIELRIPSERFDDVVSGLRPLGKVESVNVTAQDVGEEYVDVAARVANAKRLEERLVGLLAARTGKLQDVLQVERELARVREEIERYEGRMRYLRSRADISSLAVSAHERAPIVGEYRSARVIAHAFGEAWRNFIGFVAGFIALLGVLVPLGLVGSAIVLVILRAWRHGGVGAPRGARPVLAETQTET